jgi:hypothetical protein
MRTITITPEAFARIEEYAEVAGMSVDLAASEAIDKWMDSTGEIVLRVMVKRKQERAPRQKLAIVYRAG